MIEAELRKASEERKLLEKRERHRLKLEQLDEERTLIKQVSRSSLSRNQSLASLKYLTATNKTKDSLPALEDDKPRLQSILQR